MADATRYTVYLKLAAERALKKLPRDVLPRIARAINHVSTDPRPTGVTALQGDQGFLRLRVGDYRIIYAVRDAALTVLVVTVGHQRDSLSEVRLAKTTECDT